jgi:signal peptidase II
MQMEDKHISIFYFIFITAAVIFLDQFTKYLAIEFLDPIGTYPIIKNVLHLTYVENTGAAFGMLKDARWVFMIVSSVAIVALAVYIAIQYKREPYICACLALIAGGGIGNMIDRIVYGFVVDFVDFRLIKFAVFNGADSFITVGAAMLIIYFIVEAIKDERAKKASGVTSDTVASADKSGNKSGNYNGGAEL